LIEIFSPRIRSTYDAQSDKPDKEAKGGKVKMANMEDSRKESATEWTVYNVFEQQTNINPAQWTERAFVIPTGQLSVAVDVLDLDASREAATKAIGEFLPTAFGKAIERQVLASYDYLRQLRSITKQLQEEGFGLVKDVLSSQYDHLLQAVKPAKTALHGKYILAAFSFIEDQSITLTHDELDRLITAVASHERMNESAVRREARRRAETDKNARNRPLESGVWDGIDILASILLVMRREGLKPYVRDAALQKWIVNYFQETYSTNPNRVERTFGGSGGNFTYMLEALGLPSLLHIPHHHERQAEIAPKSARRVVFGTDGPVKPFTEIGQGSPDDASRFSFVFQLTPQMDHHGHIIGPNFKVDGRDNCPIRPDRVILRIPNARTDTPADWERLQVIWKGEGLPSWRQQESGIKENPETGCWFVDLSRSELEGLLENDWPNFPLFQHGPRIEGSTLFIELASTDEMIQIAGNLHIVLFGGIQGLGKKWYNQALTELLREAFVKQLQVLSGQQISLHVELGPVDSRETMSELRRLFKKAKMKNLSLNRGELVQISSQFGSPCFVYPQSPVPTSSIGIYYRARQVLRRLSMETVFVHDVELAILVRRNPKGEDSTRGKEILESHRQAMLRAGAAVPAALFRRAKEKQVWDLALSTESLAALLEFAMDYSAFVASADRGVKREDILRAILTDGYYYPGEGKISVVVAPTIFVEFPRAVSLTGAGDFCFTTHAATAS
jgi:hypothetical protein